MKLVYTLAIALGLTAGPLFAQSGGQQVSDTTDVELTRSVIQAEKKMIVAANVDLTEEESQGFWPIYNDYQNEMQKLNDRLLALIEDFAANYETMTDAKAKSLLEESYRHRDRRARAEKLLPAEVRKSAPGEETDSVLPGGEQAQGDHRLRSRLGYPTGQVRILPSPSV